MALTNSDKSWVRSMAEEQEERFKEVFATKEDLLSYKSELVDKLDDILKEIVASREEETILSHKVSDHEDRIETIEEKLDINPSY